MLEILIMGTILEILFFKWIFEVLHYWLTDAMSSNETQFWGAVIGAAIAVAGAYSVSLHTIKAERRNLQEANENKRLYDALTQIEALEIFLHKYIKVQQKNSRLLTNIIANDKIGTYMMTLPRRIEFDLNVSELLNQQLLNETLNLEFGIRLNNEMIEDFVDHYKQVATYLRPVILENKIKDLNQTSLNFQHEDIKTFAKSVKVSTDEHLRRAIDILAIIYEFADDNKSNPLKAPKDLIWYKANEKRLLKRQIKLQEEFKVNPFRKV